MKSILVLLDANIIIDLFILGYWKNIIKKYKVYIPSIIVDKEARYFESPIHGRTPIDLSPYISQGQIEVLYADATDYVYIQSQFDSTFILDKGEMEAIALMKSSQGGKHIFCTGDAAAIKALSMLNMSDRGISLEELFKKIGINPKDLEKRHQKSFFDRCLQEGFDKRLRGEGLSVNANSRI